MSSTKILFTLKATACKNGGMKMTISFMINEKLKKALEKEAKRLQMEITGSIPFDENIAHLDLEGKPTYNLPESSPAVRELGSVFDTLLH